MPPYLSDVENQAFVDGLVQIGLKGRDLGKVFYEFALFGMNEQDIAQFIRDHFTNLFDIAGFLYELNLSPEELNRILVLLPSDWRTYLEGQIAMFDRFSSTFFEGEFQGFSGTDLINFINNNMGTPLFPLPAPGVIPTLLVMPPWVVPSEPPNIPINGSSPF